MATSWPGEMNLLDRTGGGYEEDILLPFAVDELLCKAVGEGRRPVIHLWRHPSALVLGLRDRRLPNAAAAMADLRKSGMQVAVRNSGGAAVPLDPGVVNVSVILPNPLRTLAFHPDFQYMVELVRGGLRQYGERMDTGEIKGAYCPGDYDLSIGGRKFCGIAQRRQTKAFIVQGFIVAEGSGKRRAELVRDFYRSADGERAGEDTDSGAAGAHPIVEAAYTASLEELGVPGGAAGFSAGVVQWLGTVTRVSQAGDGLAAEAVWGMVEQLRNRYDK